jgi:parallel beta-helix repeat protein
MGIRETRGSAVNAVVLAASLGALASACSSKSEGLATDPSCTAATHCKFLPAGSSEDDIQSAVATAHGGDTLKFGAGTFAFKNEITLAADDLTVLGAGIDQTILDFQKQAAGSEAVFAQQVKNLRLEGFTLRDPKGNGIKVLAATGLTIRSIKTLWTSDDSSSHGAYGLYPVQSSNVLVEKCIATGASDTGVYVGQSQHVMVRDNEAYQNVAGIEIENSYFVDVYRNDSHDNAGGILVFDLPNLQQLGGHDVRVHDNKIHDNNTPNFAPKGNIVGLVPAGTGFFVMANSNVEVFSNTFVNNQTAQSSVISYFITQDPFTDTKYYAYPSAVYLHDNTYASGGTRPDLRNQLGLLLVTGQSKFPNGVTPEVIYDGILDPAKTTPPENPMRICIKQPGAVVANLHLDKVDAKNPDLSKTVVVDSAPYDCTLPPVDAVVLPGVAP